MTKNKKDADLDELERATLLAERVKLLFQFCADLFDDIDLLEKVLEQSNKKKSFALSAAPLLGAVGMDYKEEEFDADLHARRAKALLSLIKTLKQTEEDRAEFAKKQVSKMEAQAQLRRILG